MILVYNFSVSLSTTFLSFYKKVCENETFMLILRYLMKGKTL
nr:MAG TPA: hypothetical protein [Siphoviridae sp. ctWYg3]